MPALVWADKILGLEREVGFAGGAGLVMLRVRSADGEVGAARREARELREGLEDFLILAVLAIVCKDGGNDYWGCCATE